MAGGGIARTRPKMIRHHVHTHAVNPTATASCNATWTCRAKRSVGSTHSNHGPISRGSVSEIPGMNVIIISAAKIAK